MKDLPSPVINSNCDNFLTPKHSKSESHITRIQPDKFTFLKSNLLVSNILNSNPKEIDKSFIKQNKQKNTSIIIGETCFNKCQRKGQIQNQQNIKQNDAYINCEVQRVKLVESSQIYYQKNQRVRNLVKYRSHKTFQQLKNQEKSLFQNIQNINLMKKQMADKAGQIMNKKQDTSYLGRNLMKQGQNFLKQLKQTNPQSKKAKIQSTRLLMKENVKKNTKAEIKNQFQDSLNYSMSRQTQSMSVGTSMLQTSFVDYVQTKNLKQKQHSDQVIAKLIKNKSYENVFLQQKRRAVWQGFSDHWKKGGEKQQAQKQLKKKINKKKVIKNKFQSTNHQILNYNDNFTRHLALKKYQTAFEETASTFKICQEV